MRTGRLQGIVSVLMGIACFAAAPALAGGHATVGCTPSSKSALRACRDDLTGSAWLEAAKCQQVADDDEREDCLEEVAGALAEGRVECGEQYDARLDVCEALGEAPYDPEIDPDDFVARIDSPFLPFLPGTTWKYEEKTDEGTETVIVEATSATREILGVTCTEVRDRVYLDGVLTEDTRDWYAQDKDGNVWYFGELSYELEDGQIVSISGSWEAGVDGAKPGLAMPAAASMGRTYRQEFLMGEAEDMGQFLHFNASVTVPYGSFTACRETRDFSPLSPGSDEHKFYAQGVGLLLEVSGNSGSRLELLEVTHP
jgi:hypothetical protein